MAGLVAGVTGINTASSPCPGPQPGRRIEKVNYDHIRISEETQLQSLVTGDIRLEYGNSQADM